MMTAALFAFYVVLFVTVVVDRRRARKRLAELQARMGRAEAALSLFDVRICRECQCTDDVACMSGCWWVEEDLCSSCADDLAAEGSSLEGGRR